MCSLRVTYAIRHAFYYVGSSALGLQRALRRSTYAFYFMFDVILFRSVCCSLLNCWQLQDVALSQHLLTFCLRQCGAVLAAACSVEKLNKSKVLCAVLSAIIPVVCGSFNTVLYSQSRCLNSIPVQSMFNRCWIKWHLEKLLSECFAWPTQCHFTNPLYSFIHSFIY
jgi:hypothetical protein